MISIENSSGFPHRVQQPWNRSQIRLLLSKFGWRWCGRRHRRAIFVSQQQSTQTVIERFKWNWSYIRFAHSIHRINVCHLANRVAPENMCDHVSVFSCSTCHSWIESKWYLILRWGTEPRTIAKNTKHKWYKLKRLNKRILGAREKYRRNWKVWQHRSKRGRIVNYLFFLEKKIATKKSKKKLKNSAVSIESQQKIIACNLTHSTQNYIGNKSYLLKRGQAATRCQLNKRQKQIWTDFFLSTSDF